MEKIKELIKLQLDSSPDKIQFLNELRKCIFDLSPEKHNPVDLVKWIPIDKIQANDYNPNQVATNELKLLFTSIDHDGYTQPIVTIYDASLDKYIIVDGFHRYYVQISSKILKERNQGYLPIVVLDKNINDRMASTIRHNRARGKHSIQGMSNIVFNMLDNGWEDHEICKELGMEADEIVKLKHITGFSKLFEDIEYKKSWKTNKQLQLERKVKNEPK